LSVAFNHSAFANANELSTCEKRIIESLPEAKREAVLTTGLTAVGAGAAAGVFAGTTALYLGSSLESTGAVTNTAMPGNVVRDAVISGVATGVVVAALAVGAGYVDYRRLVDRNESLLQLIRDTRNGGMGPQSDIRVDVIQRLMAELIRRSKGQLKTVDAEAIRSELVVVVNEVMDSSLVDCADTAKVSKDIDRAVMSRLVNKQNAGLKVDLP